MRNFILMSLVLTLCSCYSTNCITICHIGEEDKPIYPITISNKEMQQKEVVYLFTGIDQDKIKLLYHYKKMNHATKINKSAFVKLENKIHHFDFFEKKPEFRYGTIKVSIWHNGVLSFQYYVYTEHSVDFLESIRTLLLNFPTKEQQVQNMINRLDIPDSYKPASILNLMPSSKSLSKDSSILFYP